MRGAHSCGAARHPQHLVGTARPWGRLVPGAGRESAHKNQ